MHIYDRLKIGDALAINFLTACDIRDNIEIAFSVSQSIKTPIDGKDGDNVLRIYRTNNAMVTINQHYDRLNKTMLSDNSVKDYNSLMDTYLKYSKEASIMSPERNERFNKDQDVIDLYEELMDTPHAAVVKTVGDRLDVRFIDLYDINSNVSLIEPVYKYKLEEMPTIIIYGQRWVSISNQSVIYANWKSISEFIRKHYG